MWRCFEAHTTVRCCECLLFRGFFFSIIKWNGETSFSAELASKSVEGETKRKAQKLFLYKTCILVYIIQFTSVLHFYIFLLSSEGNKWYHNEIYGMYNIASRIKGSLEYPTLPATQKYRGLIVSEIWSKKKMCMRNKNCWKWEETKAKSKWNRKWILRRSKVEKKDVVQRHEMRWIKVF